MKLIETLPGNPKSHYLTRTIGIGICKECKSGCTMIAHKFINCELELDLKNPTNQLRMKL